MARKVSWAQRQRLAGRKPEPETEPAEAPPVVAQPVEQRFATVVCPRCRTQLTLDPPLSAGETVTCGKCGEAVRLVAPSIPFSWERLFLGLLGIIAIVALVMIVGIVHCNNNDAPSPSDQMHDEKIAAWVTAQVFVERSLKSPGTAKYGSSWDGTYQDPDERVAKTGPDTYRVSGWVDSQNSFGALIRSQFVCSLKHEGGDDGTWTCLDLNITGP